MTIPLIAGWNKSLPLPTKVLAYQHMWDLQKQGYETKLPSETAPGEWVVWFRAKENLMF